MFEPGKKKDILIASPVDGVVIPISQINDPVFSEDILGRGIAIVPASEDAVSPADAKIDLMVETGHATNLVTDNGVDLLIHIGIDTVKLQGRHFTKHKNSKEHVKAGDALITFDAAAIAGDGFDTTIAIVVCNPDTFSDITFTKKGPIKQGEPLITIKK